MNSSKVHFKNFNIDFQKNPDVSEAHKLRGWWSAGGSSFEHSSISNKSTTSTGLYCVNFDNNPFCYILKIPNKN